jgi:hypothetical protein
MALRCTVCQHPAITDIDKGLMAGYSFRSLAEQYGVSASALFRHTRHLARRLELEGDHREHQHQVQVLDKLDILEHRLNRLFTQAREHNSYHVALGCIQEHVRLLALIEKIRHRLRGQP